MTPPNLKDVSQCCMNCDFVDKETGMHCDKYNYDLEHPAFVCDGYGNG